jgi:hypothetical protein
MRTVRVVGTLDLRFDLPLGFLAVFRVWYIELPSIMTIRVSELNTE